MPTLRILSGGAAQGLVNALAPRLRAETGHDIEGEFGAVGTMADKLRSGAPADILILTSKLISTLAEEGYVAAGTRADVGTVETGIAVRSGDEPAAVGNGAALRAALLAADEIYIPDPQQATAGIHFANVLRSLGIWEGVEKRIRAFPNGATAMRALAASSANRPIGCTQVTEILNTMGVTLIAPLPEGYELATVYTAAVTARAAAADAARALIDLLTAPDAATERRRAGFV
ncbi:MAG: substrate-binding domain-containing protein [Pseudomonadota bacterium]|nr:substrate-binding domain-containing protein [Pseudomonadota bacterium]